jgi:hypothetical protein
MPEVVRVEVGWAMPAFSQAFRVAFLATLGVKAGKTPSSGVRLSGGSPHVCALRPERAHPAICRELAARLWPEPPPGHHQGASVGDDHVRIRVQRQAVARVSELRGHLRHRHALGDLHAREAVP